MFLIENGKQLLQCLLHYMQYRKANNRLKIDEVSAEQTFQVNAKITEAEFGAWRIGGNWATTPTSRSAKLEERHKVGCQL